jgi:hypothetical protein
VSVARCILGRWAEPLRFETGHNISFSSTTILDKALAYMDRLIRESIEIRLHLTNLSRDEAFKISWSWYLVTNLIKHY